MGVQKLRVTMMCVASAAAVTIGAGMAPPQPQGARDLAAAKEWPTYGHDPGGMRFSPLTQLTPANVAKLEVAWVYHMRPAAAPPPAAPPTAPPAAPPAGRGRGRGGSGFASSESTPLVIGGVMYASTPYYRVVALDATTGKEIWAFQLPSGNPSTRGIEYWPGDARTPPQIVFGTSDARLYSLNAKTGVPNDAFGDKGVVALDTPEILQGLPGRSGLSSPPIVYRNLVITGGTTQENPPRGPAGDVRAWDMHTGKLVWTFHSVPRAGAKYNDTWAGDSWKNRSGRERLGIHHRRRLTRHRLHAVRRAIGRSVRRRSGRRQPVRHEPRRRRCDYGKVSVALPDRPPRHLGRRPLRRAAAARRETGSAHGAGRRRHQQSRLALHPRSRHWQAALWCRGAAGSAERSAARADGEDAALSLKPPPLSRMSMTPDDVATVTPELEAACRKLIAGMQLGGPYLPVSYNRLRVQFPGNHGGVNWGGMSYNPQLGLLFINTNELGTDLGAEGSRRQLD